MAQAQNDAPALETQEQKFSYTMGYQFGSGLMRQGVPVDLELYFLGVEDAMNQIASKIGHEEGRQIMVDFQTQLREKQMAKLKAEADANLGKSEAFLKENAAKEGVQVTDSGLQYEVLSEGSGPKPSAGSQVTVHYIGTLADGTVFDSSVERGQPATFGLGQVIPGWTEGLQLMSLGAKYKFTIPPAIGYGERGAPPRIPPNSALVFEVELLEIE